MPTDRRIIRLDKGQCRLKILNIWREDLTSEISGPVASRGVGDFQLCANGAAKYPLESNGRRNAMVRFEPLGTASTSCTGKRAKNGETRVGTYSRV